MKDLTHAGDVALKLKLTNREQQSVDTSVLIHEGAPDFEEMAYQHAVLCQVGLPRRKVEGNRFMRRSGSAWMQVQSGVLDEGRGPVAQPVPYGALPRLALAYIQTFAVQNNTPVVPMKGSAGEFLKAVGADLGGKRYANLRRQMHALAACHIQLGYRGRTFSGVPIERFNAWAVNRSSGDQGVIWPGELLLSHTFYETLRSSAVVLDKRALLELRGSALALDVYTWLAHRLWRIKGGSIVLPWQKLKEQFGHEYRGKHGAVNFKKEFTKALRAALRVYPKAVVKPVQGGLLLVCSPPPVPRLTSGADFHIKG